MNSRRYFPCRSTHFRAFYGSNFVCYLCLSFITSINYCSPSRFILSICPSYLKSICIMCQVVHTVLAKHVIFKQRVKVTLSIILSDSDILHNNVKTKTCGMIANEITIQWSPNCVALGKYWSLYDLHQLT